MQAVAHRNAHHANIARRRVVVRIRLECALRVVDGDLLIGEDVVD